MRERIARGGRLPAGAARPCAQPWGPARILARRLFPSRVALPEPWASYCRRAVETPGIRRPRHHDLRRAF